MNKVEIKKILDNAPNGAYWFIGIHPHGYCNELGDFHSSGVDHGFTYCNLSDEVWESMICLGDLMAEMEKKTQTKEVEWENGELLEYKDGDDEWSTDGRYVCFDAFANHHVFYAANMNLYHAGDEQIRKPETPEAKKEREELEAAYDLYCELNNNHNCVEFVRFKINCNNWLRVVRKTGYRVEK